MIDTFVSDGNSTESVCTCHKCTCDHYEVWSNQTCIGCGRAVDASRIYEWGLTEIVGVDVAVDHHLPDDYVAREAALVDQYGHVHGPFERACESCGFRESKCIHRNPVQ